MHFNPIWLAFLQFHNLSNVFNDNVPGLFCPPHLQSVCFVVSCSSCNDSQDFLKMPIVPPRSLALEILTPPVASCNTFTGFFSALIYIHNSPRSDMFSMVTLSSKITIIWYDDLADVDSFAVCTIPNHTADFAQRDYFVPSAKIKSTGVVFRLINGWYWKQNRFSKRRRRPGFTTTSKSWFWFEEDYFNFSSFVHPVELFYLTALPVL